MGEGVLVDTVVYTGAIRTMPSRARHHQVVEAGTAEILDDSYRFVEGPIRFDISKSYGTLLARVEYSLPNFRHGTNIAALDPTEAIDVLQDIDREVGKVIRWVNPDLRTRSLSRVDLVRDFHDVPDIVSLTRQLETHSPYSGPRIMHRTPSLENQAASLMMGRRRRWSATLYDKHAQVIGRRSLDSGGHRRLANACEGTLRYELRLWRPVLRESRAITIPDLEAPVLERMLRDKWEKCGLGREVVPPEQWRNRLEQAEITNAKKISLLGYVDAMRNGPAIRVDPKTKAAYEKMLREIGVPDCGGHFSEPVRLDFDACTLTRSREG